VNTPERRGKHRRLGKGWDVVWKPARPAKGNVFIHKQARRPKRGESPQQRNAFMPKEFNVKKKKRG